MSPEVEKETAQKTFAKKSLFEFSAEGVDYALNTQPTVNIPYALANDWVPGYADQSNSVYAASGSGYTYLSESNVTGLWNMSRNIAYVVFVVILMAAGFMIMFRNKVGGQMAVTVYNTIPNVILGLILVTFSFAIVGLILNVSALLTNIAHGILSIGQGDGFYVGNFFSMVSYVFHGVIDPQSGLLKGDISTILADVMVLIPTVITMVISGGLGGILVLVLVLLVLWTYIVAFWNIWLLMFKTYLAILLDTVLGPIILAFSVFPGNSKLMIGWFNRLIRNALVFPAVFFIINASFKLSVDLNMDMGGLIDGSLDTGTPSAGNLALGFFKMVLPLAALFFAVNIPKILEEVFPSQGSQGLTAALQGVQGGFSKIPMVGGLFAGGGK
jgi:hypothetical protein